MVILIFLSFTSTVCEVGGGLPRKFVLVTGWAVTDRRQQ